MMTKHLHLTAVALSIILFILRFVWLQRNSTLLHKKWVKIVPHVIDTLLLVTAITLCFIVPFNPIQHPWLWQKIVLVIAYIGLGFYVLKFADSAIKQWGGFTLAIVCLMLAANLAVSKQALIGF
ncbi:MULTISPECIES: SirB2 family protein [Alteromonadaceae]|uniref:SirB2 family protein n=1 Tax=Alteromonadaceae TaxID=72275 RepID=UPI002091AEF5|nr:MULTISPECIES: SirB2 family protein [Aliiglaciecola]MDO6710964.1 SirB2 family protein [Aliiglaciecola sp. 2_MG-2023]MDO6752445.1 SirB2 family protein [Aliiglaciecola sp. 1_MG-2023]